MSYGRYQLVRKEDHRSGNKASGLDLDVEDGKTASAFNPAVNRLWPPYLWR